jgi:hypothetical protein
MAYRANLRPAAISPSESVELNINSSIKDTTHQATHHLFLPASGSGPRADMKVHVPRAYLPPLSDQTGVTSYTHSEEVCRKITWLIHRAYLTDHDFLA